MSRGAHFSSVFAPETGGQEARIRLREDLEQQTVPMSQGDRR